MKGQPAWSLLTPSPDGARGTTKGLCMAGLEGVQCSLDLSFSICKIEETEQDGLQKRACLIE